MKSHKVNGDSEHETSTKKYKYSQVLKMPETIDSVLWQSFYTLEQRKDVTKTLAAYINLLNSL